MPLYFNYMFMVVENADEFAAGTDPRPKVREAGPYAFIEKL